MKLSRTKADRWVKVLIRQFYRQVYYFYFNAINREDNLFGLKYKSYSNDHSLLNLNLLAFIDIKCLIWIIIIVVVYFAISTQTDAFLVASHHLWATEVWGTEA